MNTDAIIPKITLRGSTINEPLISFIQNYPIWTMSNYCLSASNGYSYLNGVIINGADNYNNIYVNNSNLIFGINNNLDNNYFSFNINNNEKIRINSIGYLGINNNNPQYHLDINGSVNYSGGIYSNNVNLDNIYLNIKNNFWVSDNKSNIYINNNINNVGIGTTIPLSSLHIGSINSINANTDNSILISKYDDINLINYNFKIGYDNNGNFSFGNYIITSRTKTWNNQLSIHPSAPNNSLFIDNSGNIGINTNNPNSYKLNVNGTFNASSISGIGSSITQINYNNITINRPDLTNLNNWISDSANKIIYNNSPDIGIGIGTNSYESIFDKGRKISYKLKVNGPLYCTNLTINDVDTDTLYLNKTDAISIYLNKNNYDWTSTINSSSGYTEISLKNNNNKLIIGNPGLGTTNVTNLCTIYGNLQANQITCYDGSYIRNINFVNITNVPPFLLKTEAPTLYLSLSEYNTYSNSIATNYTTKVYVDGSIVKVQKTVDDLIKGSVSTSLINSISQQLELTDYTVTYSKLVQNPINSYIFPNSVNTYYNDNFYSANPNIPHTIFTFGFNAVPDIINSNNIIKVGGNIISTNDIIAFGNIKENNSNLSNIYISSNVYNNNIIYYDKIVDRKLDACTQNNYYPPPSYQYNYNYSNVVTNSPYGNGIYQILTSTLLRGYEYDGNYNETSFYTTYSSRSYQLFNTSNTSNNFDWRTTATNGVIGFYQYINTDNTRSFYYYDQNNQNSITNPALSNVTVYYSNDINSITSNYGHWIQYYYSESIVLNNIELFINNINIANSPRKITLLAKNDLFTINDPYDLTARKWDILLSNYIINTSSYSNTSNYPFTNTYTSDYLYCKIPLNFNTNNYKYYRIIINELNGGKNISLNQIKFNGVEIKKEWKHSGNNIYSYSNISINTIDDISPYKLNVNGFIYSSSNIYANSNIGIGTTSPLANLHIGSTNSSSDGTIMISKFYNNINTNLKLGYDNNYNFIIGDYNSNLNNWNSQIIINSNASSNSLLIDNNGNIGINTTNNNPNFKFNVNGSTFIYNGIINQSNSQSSLTSFRNNFYNDIFASNNIISSNIITSNFTANYYSTFSNILSCLSNVGIGITNNFNGTLHINTNSNLIGIWNASSILESNKYISQFIGKNNSSSNGFYTNYNHIGDGNSNNYLSFTTSNFYPILNLIANCNIGIGITNPSGLFQIGNGGKFTINNFDNTTALFGLNNTDDKTNTKIYLNISNIEYYASSNNGTHRFYTSNIENVRIDYSGNIGIGTTNANNFKLNVNGNTFISSNLYLNSNIGVGTTNPRATVDINNGSFLLNNFKFGNINNNTSNLIIGNSNFTNNSWISQFIINSNASSNSIVISNNNYVGINNSNPIANIHIGDINQTNSTFVISQNNRNFKIAYDNNYNFSFGDLSGTNNNNWNQQFYINSSATSNSLIIDNNGNIGINTGTNNNSYKLNLNGNLIQLGDTSYNQFNGYVGINTTTADSYRLNVNGTANITSLLKTSNINNIGTFVQTGDVRIDTAQTIIKGGITFSNSTLNHSGGIATFDSSLMNINSATNITNNLSVTGLIKENNQYLNQTYVKLSNLSNLSVNNVNLRKKYGVLCTLPSISSFNYNGINYYSYNIDLNKISTTSSIGSGDTTINRLFNIKCFKAEDNFETFNSGFPNILQYDIYMSSNKSSSLVNICAIGTPENNLLSNILPTNISILRSSLDTDKFNNLSIVSPNSGIQVCYITEDYLN
jgi:hypothetical protein